MNANWKSVCRVVPLLLLGIALAGCASRPTAASPELAQRIEAAHTRSDHVALANYYSQEANAAHDRAGEHRKMAKSYQGVTTTGRGPGANMPAHCKSLVNLYEGIAAEYEGMSVDHQKLAESAPT